MGRSRSPVRTLAWEARLKRTQSRVPRPGPGCQFRCICPRACETENRSLRNARSSRPDGTRGPEKRAPEAPVAVQARGPPSPEEGHPPPRYSPAEGQHTARRPKAAAAPDKHGTAECRNMCTTRLMQCSTVQTAAQRTRKLLERGQSSGGRLPERPLMDHRPQNSPHDRKTFKKRGQQRPQA